MGKWKNKQPKGHRLNPTGVSYTGSSQDNRTDVAQVSGTINNLIQKVSETSLKKNPIASRDVGL